MLATFQDGDLDKQSQSLDDIKAAIKDLENEHAAKGRVLSGRVVHVCHYLPVVASLPAKHPLTPPGTPDPAKSSSRPSASGTALDTPEWSIGHRQGHSALISGIRSLSSTHEQVLVGWTGDLETGVAGEYIPTSTLSDSDRASLEREIINFKEETDSRPLHLQPVWMSDKIAHGHYEGYCKNILWPLFHYLLWQDVATEAVSTDDDWEPYLHANEAFASKVKEIYQPGDLIWVHDYHLLLVPGFLRKLLPDATIGLFVHTPFPSSEVFRCLPRRKEVLDGMLGANLVCFQTYAYSRHFASSCIRVCGYEIVQGGIDVHGHLASVGHCAVGIDVERVTRDTLMAGIQPKLAALTALYEGKKIIVGRDKLDVVKGVVQKLKGFEKFLRDYPEWRGRVVLIQVTSPSLSDSAKLERQISELVASINGEFGSLDFIPVHHYHQTITKDEFYALLSAADLALITPLRDGMNTTSMEFVLCQQKTNKSPLILSEFTGISSTMARALQINPWNLGDVAAAIHKGLSMSASEKIERHASLYRAVTTHTSHSWAATLLRMLLTQMGNELTAHQTPVLDRSKLKARYRQARKRLFLFDYDGTLTPIVKTPSMAVPSSDALRALSSLTEDPLNVVYIISGRDSQFLDSHFGKLRDLGMSAEHGSFVRTPGSESWRNLTESLDMSWMSEVAEIFRYYTERTTGSHIEIKKSSITWHYRASDPEWGLFQCRQCQDLLENNLAHKRPIEVLVGKKNLEVRPKSINKGEIVKTIVSENPDAEFIFCAGDDKTDEDMFRALRIFSTGSAQANQQKPTLQTDRIDPNAQRAEMAIKAEDIFATTVGASSKMTLASWHVTTPEEVIETMLEIQN